MDIKLTDADAERIKILNSEDLYGIMQRILLREDKIDQNRERFWVIGLENNCRILFMELICLGSVNRSITDPMEVFSLALQKRAVQIILCHNHPSGELRASMEDKDSTDRLIQVGKIVSTPVLDHLIISDKSYISFQETGLMEKLEKSIKYVPPYMLKERYEKEATQIAKRTQTVEIARQLKLNGVDLKTISDSTGLSIEEVEGLRRTR